MAEGLEEESKKSLQMEAELEKQLSLYYKETSDLKLNLSMQEKRYLFIYLFFNGISGDAY